MKNEIESLIDGDRNRMADDLSGVIDDMRSYLTDDSRKDYYRILSAYNKAKKQKQLKISDIAESCNLAAMTVKRIENLQSLPNITTLLKMLDAVGLTLTISSKK